MIQNKRKAVVIAVLLVVFAGVGYVAYREYVSIRQSRLVSQAKHFMAKSDYKKSALLLQRALKYRPHDIEAMRLMADLADGMRSPTAITWRSRVVELNSYSLEDRLALAQSALSLREYLVASNALAGVNPADMKTAAYQNLAGAADLSVYRIPEAEHHFMEAIRLEPKLLVPQLNLAIMHAHDSNAAVRAEATKTLQTISVNPTNGILRCMALRQMIADATNFRQTNAAFTLSEALVRQTNSTVNDKMLRLDTLKLFGSPDFKPTLAQYQREATTNLPAISELALWQMSAISPGETLNWLQTLPMSIQTNQSIEMLSAEGRVAMQDWKTLHRSLTNQNWSGLEFVRHAFISRAMRGENLAAASKLEWEQAVKFSNNQKEALIMLTKLATRWGWQNESEELLWSIATHYQTERWAVAALVQTLSTDGRTRPLMTLYNLEAKRFPSDLMAKNNVALTALLLGATELKPHELAREVYEKIPTNTAFASTYAFSLHIQGKDAEALKVMQQLKPDELAKPAIAGYYGLVLKATGDKKKARTYFEIASKGKLLPEEQKLFEKAAADI